MPFVLHTLVLALAVAALLMGCRGNPDIAPELLRELSTKQGEVTTLTSLLGVLGTALVVLGSGLAAALFVRRRREGRV